MPVKKFSTVAKIATAAQTRRNSPRGSATRQNGNNSMNLEGNSRGRKRKTKVKNAKRSKRGSQKKRGRRASRRQRGGSFCQHSNRHRRFIDILINKIKEVGGRKKMAQDLTGINSLDQLDKYFGTEILKEKSMPHTKVIEQCSDDPAFIVSYKQSPRNFFMLLRNIDDENELYSLLNEKVTDGPDYKIKLGGTGFNSEYFS